MKKLISNKEYHDHEAVGSTLLKTIHNKTVYHAVTETFEETDSKLIGSAAHAMILEPETFEKDFIVAPKVDRRTNKGKEEWAKFVEESEGKTLLTDNIYDKALLIKNAVLAHPIANKVLTNGESEYSYFSVDKITGLQTKCRPDYINGGALIDLKTTTNASFEGFSKQIGKLGYHIQAAFYLDVYNQSQGTDFKEFFFVAVENKAPYAVAVYKLDETHINAGRASYRKALDTYAEYLKACLSFGEENANHLFGYPADITTIQVPYYFLDQIKAS